MERYNQAVAYQRALDDAKKWLDLNGKPGHCGAGYLHGLGNAIRPVMYHQETPGAKNYHECPEAFGTVFTQLVKEKFDWLAQETIRRMEAQRDRHFINAKEDVECAAKAIAVMEQAIAADKEQTK